jgi:1-deoxy-D-xylulose-5-phosphate synthase
MQRAYDQVIHDVAIQKLPVVFCLDRAGLVGADGPTHHGAFDLAYMRCIPNMVIAAPMNESELRNMMFTAQLPGNGPIAIRYPRGQGVMAEWKTPFEKLEIGKGRKICDGEDVAILSIGHIGNYAVSACSELNDSDIYPAHYDLRFAKPLDRVLLHEIFSNFSKIITVEDGCLPGGFGSSIIEFMSDNNYAARIVRLGIPDKIIEHGEPEQLHKECGYDTESIKNAVIKLLEPEFAKF